VMNDCSRVSAEFEVWVGSGSFSSLFVISNVAVDMLVIPS
jgi:hypothetical protein